MRIEVATQQSESTKDRGDLLETLSEKLLRSQNYEVDKEIRSTGVELDLLCVSKANRNKELYVECKAYRDNRNIDSTIIDKMLGIKQRKKYEEAWLISTCPLGKEAKGIVKELMDDNVTDISFYTPKKLVSALVDSKVIVSLEIAKTKIVDVVRNNLIGKTILLITSYGDFWAFEYMQGGKASGALFAYANSGEIVDDSELLEELSKTDTSFKGLDFHQIHRIDTTSNKQPYKLEFDNDHYNSMMDTGVKFTHPNKNQLNIDDIFIYQDLQIINDDKKINASKLNTLSDDRSRIFIFGDEVSGKTTLAYKLQREYFENGYIPVYINACTIKSSEKSKLTRLIYRNIKRQYNNITDKTIGNLSTDKFILIIDDFHNIKTNNGATILSIKSINELAEKVVFLSNSSRELKLRTDNELSDSLSDYTFYKINELGYKLRDELIGLWVSIGQKETIGEDEKHKTIVDLANTINTTVGRNFVPTYPIYVLTLLQSFEATTAKSLQGSAYAEFYNYLITQSLGSTGIKASDLHLYFSFLSELAYSFFKQCTKEVTDKELNDFHDDFCNRKIIKVPFEKIRQSLVNSKLLKHDSGSYCFNHNYIYYFFVAKYFSENTTKDEIKSEIQNITDRLYRTEFANIIIFLVHFSKNDFILDGIIQQAKSLFSDIKKATFDKNEFININNLISQEIKIVIEDKTVKESRDDELAIRDEIEESNPPEPTESNNSYTEDIKKLDIFGKINLSFKLMEILGQIAKNYYGALDGDVKIYLVEETYNLGLRSLNSLMQDFDKYTDVLEEEIHNMIEKKNINSNSDMTTLKKKIVFDFASMLSFTFVAKTANSVASRDLQGVFEIVYDRDMQIGKKLINTAIELDFPLGLNVNSVVEFNRELKGNNLATMLLKLLVTRHLYKFNVKYDSKQKICERLNIGLEKQRKMLTSVK